MGITRTRGVAAALVFGLGFVLTSCSTPPVGDPTTAPAPSVTPVPVPTAVPLAISTVSASDSVARGDPAKVSISTAAGATCTIEVRLTSGPSSAAGLEEHTADASGKVTWSWTVAKNTNTGTYPINVHCFLGERDGTLGFTIKVH